MFNQGASEMQTSLFRRFTAAAIVLVAGLGVAAGAHARSDVSFSIGVQMPRVYVQPAPIYYQPEPAYVQPRPIHVQPRPVYVQPRPVYVQPRQVYVQPAPIYFYQQPPALLQPPVYGPYYGPGRGWNHDKWERKQWRKHHGRDGDRDWRGHRDWD